MALLFMDGFDHYNPITYGSLKWDNTPPGSGNNVHTTGRLGIGKAFQMGFYSGGAGYLYKTLAASHQTLICGFALAWYQNNTNTPPPFFSFLDESTVHVYFRRDTSTKLVSAYRGDNTLLGTYSIALNDNVWYYLEFKVTISNTVGILQFRVNEYLALNLSGIDTRNGGNETANKIRFGSEWYTAATLLYVDDVYVCNNVGVINNDFLGDCRVDALVPNGAGYSTQWTPSAGSNYQCIDDALFDNGTDYVSEVTVDEIDSYAYSDLPVGINNIKGIQTNVFAKRADVGYPTKFKPLLRPVSTNYEKTEVTPTVTYYNYIEVTELNPETSAVWAKAEIDAMEVGLKLTANG